MFDRSNDRVGVILVHGFIHGDLESKVESLIGSPWYKYDVHIEGGYDVTLITTQEIDMLTASSWVWALYEQEDDIPDMNPDNDDALIFVGIQDTPVEVVTEDDEVFYFVGGIHGYCEYSTELYTD